MGLDDDNLVSAMYAVSQPETMAEAPKRFARKKKLVSNGTMVATLRADIA